MNKTEREELARLARQRARLAKSKAAEREKILLAEAEDLMATQFAAQDEAWASATTMTAEACRRANEQIKAECAVMGIPAHQAPVLVLNWQSRSTGFTDESRRAELRRVAQSRLAALTASAKTAIDEQLLEIETALIAGGLESAEAAAFLQRMPTAEQLMPALSLDDLGVKTWQPPQGAAAALLTPSTPADRKRTAIRRAIEANPGASDRQIAAIAGCDHKTVAAHRDRGEPAGELPARARELPAQDGGLVDELAEARSK